MILAHSVSSEHTRTPGAVGIYHCSARGESGGKGVLIKSTSIITSQL